MRETVPAVNNRCGLSPFTPEPDWVSGSCGVRLVCPSWSDLQHVFLIVANRLRACFEPVGPVHQREYGSDRGCSTLFKHRRFEFDGRAAGGWEMAAATFYAYETLIDTD